MTAAGGSNGGKDDRKGKEGWGGKSDGRMEGGGEMGKDVYVGEFEA